MFFKFRSLLSVITGIVVLFAPTIINTNSKSKENSASFMKRVLYTTKGSKQIQSIKMVCPDGSTRFPCKDSIIIFDKFQWMANGAKSCPNKQTQCITVIKSIKKDHNFTDIKKKLNVSDPKELGIVFIPKKVKTKILSMSLGVYSGEELIAIYKLDTTGEEEPYNPLKDVGKGVRGYTFVLDPTAMEEIKKSFVEGTSFDFSAEVAGTNSVEAAFYVVNTKSVVKQPK